MSLELSPIPCQLAISAFQGKSLKFIWELEDIAWVRHFGFNLRHHSQPQMVQRRGQRTTSAEASSASPSITLFNVLLLALKGKSLEFIWEVSLGSAILDSIQSTAPNPGQFNNVVKEQCHPKHPQPLQLLHCLMFYFLL